MALSASRRSFITGLGAIFAVPAIVRVSSLMPVKALLQPTPEELLDLVHQRMLAAYEATHQAMLDNLYSDGTSFQLSYYDVPSNEYHHKQIASELIFDRVPK